MEREIRCFTREECEIIERIFRAEAELKHLIKSYPDLFVKRLNMKYDILTLPEEIADIY